MKYFYKTCVIIYQFINFRQFRVVARSPASIWEEELCSNSSQLKAINYCCKALHVRYMKGVLTMSLVLVSIRINFRLTMCFFGLFNWDISHYWSNKSQINSFIIPKEFRNCNTCLIFQNMKNFFNLKIWVFEIYVKFIIRCLLILECLCLSLHLCLMPTLSHIPSNKLNGCI